MRRYDADGDALDLYLALNDPVVWEHIPGGAPASWPELSARFARRLASGLRATWVIETGGDLVGTSSLVIDLGDCGGMEIGATYLAPRTWGSGINRRAKVLLIDGVFAAGATWVQFRTDERNLRSAAAILKLGAVELGAREDKWIRADGTRRVSRFFRIYAPI